MGGDEKKILWNKKDEIRTVIRKKYNIPHDAFLIITGGKIDKAKNIHTLTQVVKKLQHLNIYLLVFGRFEADMNPYIDCFHGNNIVVTGWIESEKAYDLFLASDLAVFPGTHSVLWEQSCASGLPGIFKKWDNGFDHIDIGGNCILLDNVSEDSLFRAILELHNTDRYKHMKHIAETIAREKFSYMSIAKRAIEYSTYEGKQ
jgi:glycosyltransferase involved in cell wall biosynthesis